MKLRTGSACRGRGRDRRALDPPRSGVVKKGTRLTAEIVARLRAEGVGEVVAARLEPGDVHEDDAARRVAEALRGEQRPPRRGRHRPLQSLRGGGRASRRRSRQRRCAEPSRSGPDRRDASRLRAGRGRPHGRDGEDHPLRASRRRRRWRGGACREAPVLSVAPWKGLKVGLAATMLPGLKPSVMDKTRRILEERLKRRAAPR